MESKLFVGAKVYITNYSEITTVITIERVTKTQAISKCGNYKFAIDISSNGSVRKIGNTDRWSRSGYYIETPELKQQLQRQEAIRKLKATDFSKLDTEKLEQILSIINNQKQ